MIVSEVQPTPDSTEALPFATQLTEQLRKRFPEDWLADEEITPELIAKILNNEIIGWRVAHGQDSTWQVPRSQFAADGQLDSRVAAWWQAWSPSPQGRGQGLELFWAYTRSINPADAKMPLVETACQEKLARDRNAVYAYVTRLYLRGD